jgi:hypothetical protein
MAAMAEMSETIYLVGTSGHPNFGDEFVTAAWLKHLAHARPDAEVWLDCPNPGPASHLFAELHPRVRFTDSLYRLIWMYRDAPPEDAEREIRHRIEHLGTPRFDLGLLDVRRAESLHVIGGGYINNHWPFHVGLLTAAAKLKDLTGLKLYATGQGFTPAPDGDALGRALESFDHVTVRDQASADLTGAEKSVDDAFLGIRELSGFGGDPTPQDGQVWVNLQSDLIDDAGFETMVQSVRKVLEQLASQGRPLHYLECIPGTDGRAYEQLADLIPAENKVSFVKLWGQEFPARPGQTWITTREHPHLMAAACGAAGVAVELEAEAGDHAALLELGTGWSLDKPEAIAVEDARVSKGFPYKSRMLVHDKLGEAKKLYPAAPKPAPEPTAPEPEPEPRKKGLFSRW